MRLKKLMKCSAMILLLPAGSCVNAEMTAMCDSTRKDRREHAVALSVDGGPRSVVTGATLIYKIDEACN